jgi:hypothetical protein
LAPRRFSFLLAVEVPTAWRPSEAAFGRQAVDPGRQHRHPALGRSKDHGELLKLGIDVGQTTVAKYMARGRRPPSQGWKTFPRNHADGVASMDLFVVPTISLRVFDSAPLSP